MASASLMMEILKGRKADKAKRLFDVFHHKCTKGDFDVDRDRDRQAYGDSLERLSVFAGVREFPIRVKCAALAWHTMTAAMSDISGLSIACALTNRWEVVATHSLRVTIRRPLTRPSV